MGIFDFFKKKQADHNDPIEIKNTDNDKASIQVDTGETAVLELTEEDKAETKPIEIVLDNKGSHGDNFGGLLGFKFLNSTDGNQLISEMMASCAMQQPIGESFDASLSEVTFSKTGGNCDDIRIRTIKTNDEILSAFPFIKTNYELPFETKQVIEWTHVANLEAEIKGGGRDTFGLAFFATDYAVNKAIYKSQKNIKINISAIGLVLDKSDLSEVNGQKVSPDFATYMPNNDLSRPTYYDFIGTLNDFTPCDLTDENKGYLLNVKLINQEDDPNFFTVDLFINKENMRINELKKGMKVAGALWFQGEIA